MRFRAVSFTLAHPQPDGTVQLRLKNSGGATLELSLGIQALSEATAAAQKTLAAARYTSAPPDPTRGGGLWHERSMSEPANWEVAEVPIHHPPAIALSFDLNLPHQLTYRLHPTEARKVGLALADLADRILRAHLPPSG